MSELPNTLAAGFRQIISRAGKPIVIKYFEQTTGSVWDDEVTLAQSGTDLWISGVVLPLDTTEGSFDSVLLEQGKLINEDQRLFVAGSIGLTGSDLQVRVGLGSPAREFFTTQPIGTIAPEASNTQIYRKAFITRITSTGSLLGES